MSEVTAPPNTAAFGDIENRLAKCEAWQKLHDRICEMATHRLRADLKWQNVQRFIYFALTLGFIAAGTGGQHLDDVARAVATMFQ